MKTRTRLAAMLLAALLPACGGSDRNAEWGAAGRLLLVFAEGDTACTVQTLRVLDPETGDVESVVQLPGPDSISHLDVDAAAGRVYYSRGGSVSDPRDTVEAVDLDGSDLQVLVPLPSSSPRGIHYVSRERRFYWIEAGTTDRLRRTNDDGSTVVAIHTFTGSANPYDLTLNEDTGFLYVSDIQYAPHIIRMAPDGSEAEIVYSLPLEFDGGIWALTLDPETGDLYWVESLQSISSSPFRIRRCNGEGLFVETVLELAGGPGANVRSLTMDPVGRRLYWTQGGGCGDPATGRIRSVCCDGSGLRTELDGLAIPQGIRAIRR